MNNNIVSFNASVSAAKPKINTTTASSNIINISLTNANLKKQKENAGVSNLEAKGLELKKEKMVREYTFEELLAAEIEKEADLKKNSLEGKTLEEILAEGRETQAEVINARNQKAVDEVKDLIDSIGEVTLDSEEDISKAAEAFFNLTDEQKAMMNPEDLQVLIAADNKLAQLKYERDKKAADNVKDLINGIGTVDLNSEADIKKAAEAYSKLTDQQKAMMDPADLQKLVDADAELARLRKKAAEEEAKRKAEAEKNKPWYEKAWDFVCDAGATVCTFTASVIEGIVDVGETIVDGVVQIGGGAISYVVGAIDEEAGAAMQKGIQDFVSYDASGSMYDAWVQASGIDPEIAYGWAHTAGNIAGQVAGYAAISMIPGGAAVAALAGGMAAAGAAAESAYANGATFNEAMLVSTVAGVAGAAGGAATNKLGSIAKGATSLKGVAGYTAAGALTGSAEPLLNSAVEYATYGNNDGKSYWEFMDESGGWMKVAMGAGAGGLSTGTSSIKGYSQLKSMELNGYSIDAELEYRSGLKGNGYSTSEAVEISMDRRSAYNSWTAECEARGWTVEPEKFDGMDRASLELDSRNTIDAETFWQRKANKDLRVENPVYSAESMEQLEQIRQSGSVDIYLTESQYQDYKLGLHEKGVEFDGRIDADGHTRAYCTKLDTPPTSSKELAGILGTDWGDGQKLYKGTLNSSSVSYSSGLEASANPDWIPGGYTLNANSPNGLGVPDLVIKDQILDPNNYKPIN